MERRLFLQSFALSLAAGRVSGLSAFASPGTSSWQADFRAALAEKPWLLGYVGVDQDFPAQNLTIEGTLPEALAGTFYRNGPARHEIGDLRYHHWFDGDGMMHAYRIGEGRVSHTGRFVQTQKVEREQAAGRALVHGFGTAVEGLQRPSSADDLNAANISILKHNGELLALWEGGSAYRLDPETLDTLGLKTWSDDTEGAPFSAHPRLDADGTLWNFGYAATVGALILYKIGADGIVQKTGIIPAPNTPMVHDFLITERHIVLILPPFVFDVGSDGAFLDQFHWRPENGGRALIIDKDDFSSIREVELPAFWVFHFANAFDDSDGSIVFDAPIYQNPSAMTETFSDVMRGVDTPSDLSRHVRYRLDPAKNTADFVDIDGCAGTDFPRIDQRFAGQQHRYSIAMQMSGGVEHPGFNTLLRIDHTKEAVSSFTYGPTELAEEHISVPHPHICTEGSGWIIGTTLDYTTGTSTLNVFNAGSVEDGPIARAHMPYAIPLGLHGNFYQA